MDSKSIGYLIMAAGVLFTYGGIKGYSPLKAIQNMIRGKNPNEGQSTDSLSVGDSGSQGISSGALGGDAKKNRELGRMLAAAMGWTGSEFDALDQLWIRESGWNRFAKNPSSGAYGIAQALPESKYPPAGREAGGSHAGTQISWGLKYIKQRYGTPSAALAHENANNWY